MHWTSRHLVMRVSLGILALTLIGIAAILPVTPAGAAPTDPPLSLLPWPKSVTVAAGQVRIGSDSRVLVASPELKPLPGSCARN